MACFDTGVNEELVKKLAGFEPLRVVFRDNGFVSDAVKINVEQIFKQMSPGTDVKSHLRGMPLAMKLKFKSSPIRPAPLNPSLTALPDRSIPLALHTGLTQACRRSKTIGSTV